MSRILLIFSGNALQWLHPVLLQRMAELSPPWYILYTLRERVPFSHSCIVRTLGKRWFDSHNCCSNLVAGELRCGFSYFSLTSLCLRSITVFAERREQIPFSITMVLSDHFEVIACNSNRSIHYGYRKCVTRARVFSQSFANGISKNKIRHRNRGRRREERIC